MNLLVTGGFGYVGAAVLYEAKKRGHTVTVFEKFTKNNKKRAKKLVKYYDKVIWGDIRYLEKIAPLIYGTDAVINLASINQPESEIDLGYTHDVNVKGLENIINAIIISKSSCKLLHISSFAVTGYTQDKEELLNINTPLSGINNYSMTKIEGEVLLAKSTIEWCILRPTLILCTDRKRACKRANILKLLFVMPIHYRVETIVDGDFANAVITALEIMGTNKKLHHKKLFIGGGKNNNHQHIVSDLIKDIFSSMNFKLPSNKYFSKKETFGDWVNSQEGQEILGYQMTNFKDYLLQIKNNTNKFHIFSWINNYLFTQKIEVDYQKEITNK